MDRTIFIVEDNEGVALLLRELCADLGAAHTHVRSGTEAIAQLKAWSESGKPLPDLAIIDVVLSEGDGFKVATALRALPSGQDVQIIMISGVYKTLPEAFLDAVRPHFLTKPFEPAEMTQTVTDVFEAADFARGIERGRLVKVAPAALLTRLTDRKATGLLTVSQGTRKRLLFWQNGQIRFGQSNVRAETAGPAQVEKGELPQAAFDAAMAHARATKIPLHEALAATRAMTPNKLLEALKRQTDDVVLGTLEMAGADWMFTLADPEKVPDVRRSATPLLLQYARRVMSPEDAREALSRLGDVTLSRTPSLEKEVFAIRAAWPGEMLLGLLAGTVPLDEVLGALRPEDAPLLWILVTADLLTVVGRLKSDGPASIPSPSIVGHQYSAAEQQARDFIFSEQQRTAEYDYYQLLGVPKNAPEGVVRQAYLDLARKYHSDAYSGLELGNAGPALSSLFQRVNEAHETLTTPKRKAEYDIYLARKAAGLPTDVGAVLKAEELFRKGEILLKAPGAPKAAQALEILDQALALNDADPEFHVYRAYAAFRGTPTPEAAEQARESIRETLERAPNLSSAYVFLGLIDRDMGADKEAIQNLEQALGMNGSDDFAKRELRAVQHRQGKSGEGSILRRLFRK
jgi:CheY-like chemotaxis protein/curved DNA-binding protein CbpA